MLIYAPFIKTQVYPMSQSERSQQPTFSQLPLRQELIKSLASLNYEYMTAIQTQSLPIILNHEDIIAQAKLQMQQSIGYEVSRLEALQAINPAIRDEEIAFFKQQLNDSEHYMDSAVLKLQALRVVVNKH